MSHFSRALLAGLALALVATMASAAPVTGIVTDARTHKPLSGMVVAAYGTAGFLSATATTDATGLYVLNVPAGQYRVLAYDPNGVYATSFDANAESFETSPLRTIGTAGATIDFALVTGGTVSGRVDAASGSLGEAVVEAYNLSGTRRAFTTTNASGEYSLVLPPGEYKLVAYDPLGIRAPSFYRDARSFSEATPVHVDAPGVTANVSFTLPAAARLSGRVMDAASHASLGSILVYVYSVDGALIASTTTAANGEYNFALPAGQYRLVAADPARAYATAYYLDSRSFERADVLTLAPAQQRAGVDIPMPRGFVVSGRANAPNITVAAYNEDGTLRVATVTDAAGNYVLVVPPGAYKIAFSDPSLTYATQFYGGAPFFDQATPLNVTSNRAGIDVTLQRGGKFTGIVRNAVTAQPLAGITVSVYDGAGVLRSSATTGADGRYALVVSPGEYRLLAFDPQLEYATGYAGGATTFEATVPRSVGADGVVTVDFNLQRGVRVTGQVHDASGNAITGAEVFALDASGHRVAGAMTSNGAFTLVVVPGTYRFVATSSGFAPRYYPDAVSFDQATWVTVTSGAPPTLTFTLQGGGRRRAVRSA
jgi:serine-aspartate repeat-containing protein C/D/E